MFSCHCRSAHRSGGEENLPRIPHSSAVHKYPCGPPFGPNLLVDTFRSAAFCFGRNSTKKSRHSESDARGITFAQGVYTMAEGVYTSLTNEAIAPMLWIPKPNCKQVGGMTCTEPAGPQTARYPWEPGPWSPISPLGVTGWPHFQQPESETPVYDSLTALIPTQAYISSPTSSLLRTQLQAQR